MFLKRKVNDYLMKRKKSNNKMPLIIKGARQIGKTESILHFANDNYKEVININFVEQSKFKYIFDDGYDVDKIIKKYICY